MAVAAGIYELFLGYGCDERCLFCSQRDEWRREPAAKLPELARSIYLAAKAGRRILVLNGGEPTLHRDVLRLAALARRAGFAEVHLQTNGLRLSDPAFAEALVGAGLTAARISIHGHTPELHDALVRVPGALSKALTAAENLRRLGAAVGMNTVLNRANVGALAGMYAWFLDKTPLRDFGLIFPLYEGDMAVHQDAVGVTLSEAAPAIRAAFNEFRKRGAEPPVLLNVPPCALPGYENRVLRWSRAGSFLDAGRRTLLDPAEYVLRQPGGRAWSLEDSTGAQRVKPAACRDCVYDDRCLGAEKGYVDRFGASELKPLGSVPKAFDADWACDKAAWRLVQAA